MDLYWSIIKIFCATVTNMKCIYELDLLKSYKINTF